MNVNHSLWLSAARIRPTVAGDFWKTDCSESRETGSSTDSPALTAVALRGARGDDGQLAEYVPFAQDGEEDLVGRRDLQDLHLPRLDHVQFVARFLLAEDHLPVREDAAESAGSRGRRAPSLGALQAASVSPPRAFRQGSGWQGPPARAPRAPDGPFFNKYCASMERRASPSRALASSDDDVIRSSYARSSCAKYEMMRLASSGLDCTDSMNLSRSSTAQEQSVRATAVSMRGRRQRHEVNPKMSPGPRAERNRGMPGAPRQAHLAGFHHEDVAGVLVGLDVDQGVLPVTFRH